MFIFCQAFGMPVSKAIQCCHASVAPNRHPDHDQKPDHPMPFDRAPSTRTTLFLSDLHLGALSAHADAVLHFLIANPVQRYVLVGDVLDLWQPLLPHWTAQDQAVIDHLNQRVSAGAEIIYVRGNHDPDPKLIPPHARLTAIHLDRYVHTGANGLRFLVLHGDELDNRLIRTHTMTRLGSRIDHALRRLDKWLRRLSRERARARSSIDCLIGGFNGLMYRGRGHERRLVGMAAAQGLDGVICGHFHIASLHRHFGPVYANCGDWVDSMTALFDPGTGELQLMHAGCASSDQVQPSPSHTLAKESVSVP
jgi:UDP-2,3-diacylglucosamine pyrophosphatase LpxH